MTDSEKLAAIRETLARYWQAERQFDLAVMNSDCYDAGAEEYELVRNLRRHLEYLLSD